MRESEIIKAASNECLKFFDAFNDGGDLECAAVVTAWLYNSDTLVRKQAEYVLQDLMQGHPIRFILDYESFDKFTDSPYSSFVENISWANFDNLMRILKKTYLCGNGLQTTLDNYMSSPRHKCKFVHDGFASIFGFNTFFPNRNSKGTFFRYNLLYYWLTFKLNVWRNTHMTRSLLPCSDKIFKRAKEEGLITRFYNSTLANAIMLTNKAKEIYGEKDFYMMYELLSYDKKVN